MMATRRKRKQPAAPAAVQPDERRYRVQRDEDGAEEDVTLDEWRTGTYDGYTVLDGALRADVTDRS